MFGLFRKKPKPGSYAMMLGLQSPEFIEAVTEIITTSDPASRVMTIVALGNLDPMLWASFLAGKEDPSAGLPANLEEAIISFEKALGQSQSEVGQRRIGWFLLASMVKRATLLAIENGNTIRIQDVWIALADAAPSIQSIIQNNIIWEDIEKFGLSGLHDEKWAKHYVLSVLMPKALKQGVKIKKYASENDVFLSIF
jgi:hypothetical protein